MANSTLKSERTLSPNKLAAARLSAGYRTKTAFAAAVGMSRGRYARWESLCPPTRMMYEQVAKVLALLNVSYEEITVPSRAENTGKARRGQRPQPEVEAAQAPA